MLTHIPISERAKSPVYDMRKISRRQILHEITWDKQLIAGDTSGI